ncbi:MAG: isocitrate/isopropylmalate dehydrogenase family protein [Pseudomonadota bacterium]
MSNYKIAWLPGDGVGNDVMEATKIVLASLPFSADYVHGDIGWDFWCKEGDPLPARTIEVLKNTDCALFGAITSKPKDEAALELDPSLQNKGLSYFSPIVRLRQEFNLHTNLRPCKAYKGNPLNYKDDIDLVVFRENTEGLYSGIEFRPVPEKLFALLKELHPKMKKFENVPLDEMAISSRIMTKAKCENIVNQGFKYAQKHEYSHVTVVEKPNVLRETGGLMMESARNVAKNYEGIDLWDANIDAMCMWLIKNPENYGILVAENMFGDIISDLSAQLVGGLGFASSGNIGDNYAVFEPTHGSAPKYAGQFKVNPIAMFLATKLMFDWLDEKKCSELLENAIAEVIAEGKVKTYDMKGTNTSIEVAQAVADKIKLNS